MKLLNALLPMTTGPTRLRPFHPNDVQPFHAYRSDAELARYQGWSLMSLPQAQAFVDQVAACSTLLLGDWIQLAIADAQTDALIGDVGLFVDADGAQAEIGFTVARGAQRLGHAVRAVGLAVDLLYLAAGVMSVRGVTDARNLGSIRTLERAGFECVVSQQAEFKGEVCTELVYRFQRSK